jgi:hypothetical protein
VLAVDVCLEEGFPAPRLRRLEFQGRFLLMEPAGGAALRLQCPRPTAPPPLKTRLFRSVSDTPAHRFHIGTPPQSPQVRGEDVGVVVASLSGRAAPHQRVGGPRAGANSRGERSMPARPPWPDPAQRQQLPSYAPGTTLQGNHRVNTRCGAPMPLRLSPGSARRCRVETSKTCDSSDSQGTQPPALRRLRAQAHPQRRDRGHLLRLVCRQCGGPQRRRGARQPPELNGLRLNPALKRLANRHGEGLQHHAHLAFEL